MRSTRPIPSCRGLVADHLDKGGIDVVGARTVAEITEGLLAIVADAKAKPLQQANAATIEAYRAHPAPAPEARGAAASWSAGAGRGIEERARRLRAAQRDAAARAVSTWRRCRFSGEFGRNLAYYTGFVFEVVTPSLGPAARSPAAVATTDCCAPSAARAASPRSAAPSTPSACSPP